MEVLVSSSSINYLSKQESDSTPAPSRPSTSYGQDHRKVLGPGLVLLVATSHMAANVAPCSHSPCVAVRIVIWEVGQLRIL